MLSAEEQRRNNSPILATFKALYAAKIQFQLHEILFQLENKSSTTP